MPNFKIICLLVPEKKIIKVFITMAAFLIKQTFVRFPSKDAPHEVWLSLAQRFQRRYLKSVNDDNDNGRRSMCIL